MRGCVRTRAHLCDKLYTEVGGKNGPNPILAQLVNNHLKKYKPAPSDIGIILLTGNGYSRGQAIPLRKVKIKQSKEILPPMVLRCVKVSCHLGLRVNSAVDCACRGSKSTQCLHQPVLSSVPISGLQASPCLVTESLSCSILVLFPGLPGSQPGSFPFLTISLNPNLTIIVLGL